MRLIFKNIRGNMKKNYSIVIAVFLGLSFLCSANVIVAQAQEGKKSNITSKDSASPSSVMSEPELSALEKKVQQAQQKAELAQEQLRQAQEKIALDTIARKQAMPVNSLLSDFIRSLAFIIVGLILLLLLKIGVRKFEQALTQKDVIRESETRLQIKTVAKLFRWVGTVTIILVIFYVVAENHGFNVAPLIAGAGIAGLAFGFGGQYLIRDWINVLFILIEGQYRINDVVKIGQYGGLVEDINLRITTLRDLEGRVIIIPNGEVKEVVNFTKEYAQALLDIGVAYKENVDHVMEVIKEIGKGLRQDDYFGKLILGDVEMLGVDDFGNSQVTIKFRMKTLPIKQWEVMRELRRRIKNRFDELGIEIPFPHQTIYWGTGKDNHWVKALAEQAMPNKGK
jgi:moderate conductance mechanosensitive channel